MTVSESTDRAAAAEAVVRELFFTPEGRADPYPRYHQLRELAPVFHSETLQSWLLTRYDDCKAALRDPRLEKHFAESLDVARARLARPPGAPVERAHDAQPRRSRAHAAAAPRGARVHAAHRRSAAPAGRADGRRAAGLDGRARRRRADGRARVQAADQRDRHAARRSARGPPAVPRADAGAHRGVRARTRRATCSTPPTPRCSSATRSSTRSSRSAAPARTTTC